MAKPSPQVSRTMPVGRASAPERSRSLSVASISMRIACGRRARAAAVASSPSGVRVKRREPILASSEARRRPTVVAATRSERAAAAWLRVRCTARKTRRSSQASMAGVCHLGVHPCTFKLRNRAFRSMYQVG